MKVEVKEEHQYGDNDVLSARHRLTDALQELIHQDGDDSESSDGESSPKHKPKKHSSDNVLRNIKTKRRRVEPTPGHAFHHTYVMKLFDRSVDLAQFEEDTPLYPICRAWMANQPRNPNCVIKRRLSSPELEVPRLSINGVSEPTLADIHNLPPPETDLVNRVPSPTPDQLSKDMSTSFLNNPSPPSREELIQLHGARWNAVRRKWQEQAHKYEERYHDSSAILTAIYNKAQENMV